MKKLTLFAISLMLLVAYSFAQAPQVDPKNQDFVPGQPQGNRADPDVYLQGDFIDLGIDETGSCGTHNTPAPVGYHNFYFGLGFVADYDLDGWAVGTPPYSGDYFLPGYPWEAWLLEFTYQGVEHTYINCGAAGYFGVPQTSLTNTSAGTVNSALWTGTASLVGTPVSVLVEQNFHFDDLDGKFFIDVTLTNTGPDPLNDVEYCRAVDPDQEVDIGGNYLGGGGYITINYVTHQPDGTNNLAEVVGLGGDFGVPMALQLTHPNAKAHVNPSGLEIFTPNTPLDATFAPTLGAPYDGDVGVGVAVRFPVLNPGESVTFPVAYVLNTTEVIVPVPVSNWAIALMIGLIVIFTVIRFRRMS